MAEIDSCRHLARFCLGTVLDLGHGGSRPLVDNAICVDREPGDEHRAKEGNWPTHLVWDVFTPLPFKDGVIDTIFSSHCLEDTENTVEVLKEWLRVIRVGGNLILFLPDQKLYEADCAMKGWIPNQAHRVVMSLDYLKDCLINTGVCHTILHECPPPCKNNPYSFEIVISKL